MEKELVVDVTSGDITIALLEDKRLTELQKEKSDVRFSVGDVFLGKVRKIMPGLNAAFVDVGYEKDAFLHYLDLGAQFLSLHKYLSLLQSKKTKIPSFQKFQTEKDIPKDGKISDVLKSGQHILVQIAKEPISMKGPRLTSEVSIAGRNLVLIPFSDKVSVSQKIESNDERIRLKRLVQSIKPRNYGVIVRTVAEEKKVAVLDNELRQLVLKWEEAATNIRNARPPKLVLSEINRTVAILRDILSGSFNNIYVNNAATYREVKDYVNENAPEKSKIVKLYKGKEPVFEHFGINKQIKSLFGQTVSFKNGSYLIIEHTEALHVIDVNSGNRSKTGDNQETSALKVNVAAAEEIARQLRLRDMGGIIVVDFIDMLSQENRQKVFEAMRNAMSNDRAKHNILPLSKFGLMQVTRQRVRPEMHIDTKETCPTCHGTGKIGPSILFVEQIENKLHFILSEHKFKKITLAVHPYIAAYIQKGVFSLQVQWRKKMKTKIFIQPDSSYGLMEYHIFDPFGDEVIPQILSDK